MIPLILGARLPPRERSKTPSMIRVALTMFATTTDSPTEKAVSWISKT